MKEILSLLPKPSRYIGIEEGSVKITANNIKQAKIHLALAFPDLYEIGMSYLGHKILYTMVNNHKDYIAERVFAPCVDAGAILKEHNIPLASIESDTDLKNFHAIGFSLTHELASTNILYMLDLAHIPLSTEERGEDLKQYPIIFMGGGCTICAELLAPYIDVMMLGEGEEMLPPFLELLEQAHAENWTKKQFLEQARFINGIYIPSFFHENEQGELIPKFADYTTVQRALTTNLDNAPYPVEQASPFGAIHNRLTLEIARGCTRGCRFCQAGFTTRPSRERSVDAIKDLLKDAIKKTGYEDVSFLSLSAGDFSALKTLFLDVSKQCAQEQISLSLPSLRVGSVDSEIMECIANIRRTGATLAPEAGSQRLRDVINKGITEEALIKHIQQLVHFGWQQVKLYFMIGLPTETYEDLEAIIDLAKKVRNCAIYFDENGKKRGSQLQVTVSVSPFVPKTHTPFQWDAQIPLEEMSKRIFFLRDLIKKEKNIKMRWHEPAMSHLEGIISRSDRAMSKVLLNVHKKGARFDSWIDHFNVDIWHEAMKEEGFNCDDYTGSRELNAKLAWEHLSTGTTKEFLLKEREKALSEKITLDCRYEKCSLCGVCDFPSKPSRLRENISKANYENEVIKTQLNFKERDQKPLDPSEINRESIQPKKVEYTRSNPPKIEEHLVYKAVRFKVWHKKINNAAYLSQLDIQPLLERALRRAQIPMTFSQGFHPLPLLSFGKALPVGVESVAEWFGITLREPMTEETFIQKLSPFMLEDMELIRVEKLPLTGSIPQAQKEIFKVAFPENYVEQARKRLDDFLSRKEVIFAKLNKQNDLKTKNIRTMLEDIQWQNNALHCTLSYHENYLSPQNLMEAIFNGKNLQEDLSVESLNILPVYIKIMKLAQFLK